MLLTTTVRTPSTSTTLFSTVAVCWCDSSTMLYSEPSTVFKQLLSTCNTQAACLHCHLSHQCGTSVVGSAAYLQATLCGRTSDGKVLFVTWSQTLAKNNVLLTAPIRRLLDLLVSLRWRWVRSVDGKYKQEKTEVLWEKAVPVTLCPPHISQQFLHYFM